MTIRRLLLILACLFVATTAGAARVEMLEGENYDLIASTTRGLRLRFKDPDLVFRIGGRIHTDAAFFDSDETNLDPDAKLRRGRVYLSGKIVDVFRFKVERDFAPPRAEWRNVWVQYRPSSRYRFTAGNFISPFGLEQMAASNFSTFMERAMSGSIAPSFQSGVRFDTNGHFTKNRSRHRWTYSLSGGTAPMGQTSDDLHRSEHWSIVTRASYAPIAKDRLVVHFGGAAEYRDVMGNDVYRIGSQTESSQGPRILDTQRLAGVNSVVSAGAEAAFLYGPVLIQGEYQHAFLQTDNALSDPDFGGGYVQASWVVTGEHREYNRGSGFFGGVTPLSNWGAVELATRYSVLDLNDGTVNGGKAKNWTVGANWYLRSNLRFMFNYVRVNAEQGTRGDSPGAADDPQIFQFRAQLFF